MQKLLVNSNYIIDYFRGQPYTKKIMGKFKNREAEGYISVITLFEPFSGAMLSPKSKESFEDIRILREWFGVIPIDEHVVYVASKKFAELRRKGKPVDIRDLFIASCAIARNLELLTNNKKHFEHITELRLASGICDKMSEFSIQSLTGGKLRLLSV